MEAVPTTCSRCQQKHHAVPGSSHEGCGGTFIEIQLEQKFKFSTETARQIFMMLDRLVTDCHTCMGQFNFVGQPDLARAVSQLVAIAAKMRDEFYRQDQSGIVIVGPNNVPKS